MSHALTRTQRTVSPQSCVVDRLDDVVARRLLLERRDGVLEVEEHHVGTEAGRLAEHLLARAGHREARPAGQVARALGHAAKRYRVRSPDGPNRASRPDTLHELADGVWVWLQPGGESGVSNAGVIADDDGLTVVDTLMVRSQWEPFAEAVAALDRPVKRVVLTHAHVDHVGGTDAVPQRRGLRVAA